jgi:hypothetical protein
MGGWRWSERRYWRMLLWTNGNGSIFFVASMRAR